MVTALKSFIPPNAAVAWATKDEILVSIPQKSGPPYICRYHKTTNGLAQALNVLLENEAPKYSLERSKVQLEPFIKREVRYTEAMREKTREILKRRGIT